MGLRGPRRVPVLERVKRRLIYPKTGCWIWTGSLSGNGYPQISCFVGSKKVMKRVHRVIYEVVVGPITERTLDHLCRNVLCVNPNHLEPVPLKENILRGNGPSAINARKTHCPRGHLLVMKPGRAGHRFCRICTREQFRAWKARNKKRRTRT